MDPGTQLGPYEIQESLGKGGMGEVYRARDTKLDRDVAIKVLPAELADDTQRLSRLEREARLLASLNHPNIAAIYGLEENGAEGVEEDEATRPALVLELVEGPTLAERMEQGPVDLEEALEIGRQIADALEVAHERGIIHRDLKPGNVKIAPDGTVKVLDFGLGKALEREQTGEELEDSPTLSAAATRAGMILGTAGYMSPEQARGRQVDRRTDIWAFGVVMHEMLSGRQLFVEETVSDTLAAVLRAEIDLDALPADTPPALRRLLRRCLVRDPRHRLRDVGDARLEIEEIQSGQVESELPSVAPGTDPTTGTSTRSRLLAAGWIVAAVALALVAWLSMPDDSSSRLVQMSILPPQDGFLSSAPAVSPTGDQVAFTVTQRGMSRIWMREITAAEPTVVPGSEGAETPFWSPDGEWLGYSVDDVLYRIRPSGVSRRRLAELPLGQTRPSWGTEGVILVESSGEERGLLQVDAAGGEARPATTLLEGDFAHGAPVFLPDGRRFLFTKLHRADLRRSEWIGTLDGTATLLAEDWPGSGWGSRAVDAGMVLYGGDTITAFDLDPTGDPAIGEGMTLVSEQVTRGLSAASGVLAYSTSDVAGGTRLVLLDREGREVREMAASGDYYTPRISNDGGLLAVEAHEEGPAVGDLKVFDLQAQRPSRSLSLNPASHDAYPVWTEDDGEVYFSSTRNGGHDVYVKAATGVGPAREVLVDPEIRMSSTDLGPDGRTLLVHMQRGSWDIYTLDLVDGGPPEPWLTTEHDEIQPAVSPDGRWVAYASDETGEHEIYIQSFPHEGAQSAKFRITSAGGEAPRWRANGTELFYLAPDDSIMSVPISLGKTVEWGTPESLFRARVRRSDGVIRDMVHYDVTPDGERFVAVITDFGNERIRVVLNWPELLRER